MRTVRDGCGPLQDHLLAAATASARLISALRSSLRHYKPFLITRTKLLGPPKERAFDSFISACFTHLPRLNDLGAIVSEHKRGECRDLRVQSSRRPPTPSMGFAHSPESLEATAKLPQQGE